MKKYLLLIILLLPISVYEQRIENNFIKIFSFENTKKSCINDYDFFQYSNEYTYENGIYTLVNPSLKRLAAANQLSLTYTCKDRRATSCETLYAAYKSISSINSEYPCLVLKDGRTENDNLYLKISDSFTRSGDKYVLTNPETIKTLDLYNTRTEHKFFCDDYSESCNKLYHIITTRYAIYVISSDDDYIYGNYYDFVDGKYILKDINTSWPDLSNNIGKYICENNTNKCDKIYQIYSYNNPTFSDIGFSSYSYEIREVSKEIKEITIDYNDNYNLKKEITNESEVWIEDKSIVKIDNDNIKPLKIGNTTVYIKNKSTGDLLIIHITINKKAINNNPRTYTNYILFTLFIILSITTIILYKIKEKRDKKELV